MDNTTQVPAMQRRALILAATTAMLVWTASTVAEMYRWVDDDGTTVYSQRPPPDRSANAIAPPPPPNEADVQRAQARLREQTTRDFDAREAAKQQAEEHAKTDQEQAIRASNCATARNNLRTIQTLGARRLKTADGIYRRLSEEERAERAAQMQKAIEENCD